LLAYGNAAKVTLIFCLNVLFQLRVAQPWSSSVEGGMTLP